MSEIAQLFTEFFRDLDVVPSDVIAGLVLLRRYQQLRMQHTINQVWALIFHMQHTINQVGPQYFMYTIYKGYLLNVGVR